MKISSLFRYLFLKKFRYTSKLWQEENKHSMLSRQIKYCRWNKNCKRRKVFKLIKLNSFFRANNCEFNLYVLLLQRIAGFWNNHLNLSFIFCIYFFIKKVLMIKLWNLIILPLDQQSTWYYSYVEVMGSKSYIVTNQ